MKQVRNRALKGKTSIISEVSVCCRILIPLSFNPLAQGWYHITGNEERILPGIKWLEVTIIDLFTVKIMSAHDWFHKEWQEKYLCLLQAKYPSSQTYSGTLVWVCNLLPSPSNFCPEQSFCHDKSFPHEWSSCLISLTQGLATFSIKDHRVNKALRSTSFATTWSCYCSVKVAIDYIHIWIVVSVCQ